MALDPAIYAVQRSFVMKRYEERLIEDMASNWWRIQLSPVPHIYKLPTELLLQIFEHCHEVHHSLASLRLVSLRMNSVATPLVFRTISLKDRSPSLAPSLPYLMKRNSRLAHACRELEFEIGYRSLTRDLVGRRPTTRHVDAAQATLLLMTPNLKILKIKFCSVPDIFTRTEDKYWEEWFGFSRTIQALSQCRRIRKLHINAYQFWDDRTRDQLVQEFWNVTNDVLTSISYMDPSYSMENMIANMPVFSRVRELAVGCIDDMPLSKLCTLLTKHFPVLNKLIIDGQHQTFTNVQPVVDVATIVPLETPLDTLIYQDCRRGPKWISAIPTRQIHFLINTECYFSFLHYLFEALQLRKGIFGRHIVRKMLIEVERPSWGKTFEDAQREHLQYFNTQTLIPTENPEETLLESIRKVCLDQGVYFTTQITECDSSMGYIYGLMQYFGSR